MPILSLQCKKCNRVFSSGINLGVGATVRLKGNRSRCPYCGSMENIPDGTFRSTVEGIVGVLEQSRDPIGTAKDLLDALEKSKTSEDLEKLKRSSKLSKFKKWIPNSLQKLAWYAAIIYVILQLLSKSPNGHIEYNQQFIDNYNQCTILQEEK
jgi:predicted Zn-ribbon and HTH transcriptional regulator